MLKYLIYSITGLLTSLMKNRNGRYLDPGPKSFYSIDSSQIYFLKSYSIVFSHVNNNSKMPKPSISRPWFLCFCSVSEEHMLLATMANPLIYFSSCTLFLSILIILIKFFNKVWWTPIRIQSLMKSQGIRGPSYRFLHGNTKEISTMIRKIRSSPQELLHHTLPMVHPHFYSWIKLYGNNLLILQISSNILA